MPAPPICPTLYPTLDTAAARIDEARASLTGNEAKALPTIDGSGSVIRSATRSDLQRAQLAARKTGTVAADAAGDPGTAREDRYAKLRGTSDERRERTARPHLDAIVVHALVAQPRGREDRALERAVRDEEVVAAAEHADGHAARAAGREDLAREHGVVGLEEPVGDAADAEGRPRRERRRWAERPTKGARPVHAPPGRRRPPPS